MLFLASQVVRILPLSTRPENHEEARASLWGSPHTGNGASSEQLWLGTDSPVIYQSHRENGSSIPVELCPLAHVEQSCLHQPLPKLQIYSK